MVLLYIIASIYAPRENQKFLCRKTNMATVSSILVQLLLAFGLCASDDYDNTYIDRFTFSSDSEDFSRASEQAKCQACPTCPGCLKCLSCPPCQATAPAGYKRHGDHGYYKLHHHDKPWNDAKNACEREGGYLVVINSKDEAKVLNSIMNKFGYRTIHAGFYDPIKNRKFVTVLDNYQRYLEWAPSQPGSNRNRNCGAYTTRGLSTIYCTSSWPFVCELYA